MLLSADVSESPRLTRLEALRGKLASYGDQRQSRPIILLGCSGYPADQLKLLSEPVLSVDLIDVAADLLDLADSLDNKFYAQSACELLKELEILYAARWGIEFTEVLLALQEAHADSREKLAPRQLKERRKRKSTAQRKAELKRLRKRQEKLNRDRDRALKLGRELVTATKAQLRLSGKMVMLTQSLGLDEFLYGHLQGALGGCGTILIKRRDQDCDQRAERLLRELLSFLCDCADWSSDPSPKHVAAESRRIASLLKKASST
jgi:hypothetical protein